MYPIKLELYIKDGNKKIKDKIFLTFLTPLTIINLNYCQVLKLSDLSVLCRHVIS